MIDAIWIYCDMKLYFSVLAFQLLETSEQFPPRPKEKKQMKPAHDSPIENEGLKGLNGEEEMEDNRT